MVETRSREDGKLKLWLEELERGVTTGNNPRDRAFIALLVRGGVSISEAVQLEIKDIDFERGIVRIDRISEIVRRKCVNCGHIVGTKYLFCSGCGRRVDDVVDQRRKQQRLRMVKIDADTLSYVRDYLRWRKRFTYRGELVFPLSRQRGWQIFRKVSRRIRLRGSVL